MKKILDIISEFVLGDKDSLTLENRIFISASLICTITGIAAIVWNIGIGLPLVLNATIAIVVVLFSTIYFFARFKRIYSRILFITVSLIFLSSVWIMNDGLDGPVPGLYILTIAVFLSITKAKYHVLLLFASSLNVALLIIAEHLFPQIPMNNYPSEALRKQDIQFGIFACLGICFLLLNFFKKSYDKENTKLVQNEVTLKKLSSSKDLLFSIIGHDLISSFNPIMGFSKIMTDKSKDLSKEQYQNFANLSHESAENAYRLLQSLLDWGKIQQGTVHVKPQKLKVKEVVMESIRWFEVRYTEKQLKIKFLINEGLNINADIYILQTVIRNLFSNAIKFTRYGGTIVLKAEFLEDKGVKISVQDNGIGIDKERIETIFQIDSKKNRPGVDGEKSAGLGLIICKGLVENHGGKIWVESEVDYGTTFKFTIPESNSETLE